MKHLGFALTSLALLLLLFTASEADISCSDVLSNLSPCLAFLRGDDDSPSGDCCDGVSALVAAAATTADRQDACECIKSEAGEDSLDLSAAQALPADCGISLPYTISPDADCSQID